MFNVDRERAVEVLLDLKANISLIDNFDRTALHQAIHASNIHLSGKHSKQT